MTAPTMTRPAPAPLRADVPAEHPIPFSRLLRVEWGKATDTRSARWLILITALGTAGLMLAPILAEHHIDQTTVGYLEFASFGITALLPIVAILTLTTEWTQRTVLTTFTQEPRRNRVITAKVCVAGIMSLAAAVYGGLVTALALLVAHASGRSLDTHVSAGVVGGFVLFVLLNVAMGVAFGALLHNSAAAIVLYFVLPTLFGILGSAVGVIDRWFDPSTVWDHVQRNEWSGHVGQILTATAVWVVVPLAAGLVRTARREIK